MDDEVKVYYTQLLAMGPGREGAMERVHFITPEWADCKVFAHHNMALSTVPMCSQRTLDSIRNLTAGKEAYILPGLVTRDDIAIADKLGGCSRIVPRIEGKWEGESVNGVIMLETQWILVTVAMESCQRDCFFI